MTSDDAPEVLELMVDTFNDLSRRSGRAEEPMGDPAPGWVRIRHLVSTDPAGAWVSHEGDRITGAALALVREGVWGLSLLVVDPASQSGGIGRELLSRSLAIAAGARGGIILSSEDPRAIRAYARAGFDLRPSVDASGKVSRAPQRPAAVRAGRWPQDAPIVDAAGRHVRGASHVTDIPAYLEGARDVLVHDGGGFLVRKGTTVALIAAHDEDVAAELLRAHIHDAGEGNDVRVDFVTAGNDWAVQTLLEAGLELMPGGPVFTRGALGPMAPYIPSGAYL